MNSSRVMTPSLLASMAEKAESIVADAIRAFKWMRPVAFVETPKSLSRKHDAAQGGYRFSIIFQAYHVLWYDAWIQLGTVGIHQEIPPREAQSNLRKCEGPLLVSHRWTPSADPLRILLSLCIEGWKMGRCAQANQANTKRPCSVDTCCWLLNPCQTYPNNSTHNSIGFMIANTISQLKWFTPGNLI